MIDFLKRLFGRTRGTNQRGDAVTAELDQEQLWEITGQRSGQTLKKFWVGTGLDVGRRRENNEDALLAIHATLGVDSGSQPLGIFVVADGMGGHRSGEIASENAVRALGNYLIHKVYEPLLGTNPHPAEESLREIMEAGILAAHNAVKRTAPGGGCTLTAALVVGNQMVIGHLGDSRAYAVESDGRMTALTKDHTLVNRLQEMGQLTAEEAAIHPQKSVLYRALGQGDGVEADIATSTLPPSGALLLCSDGLWGFVPEEDIEQIINAAATPELACQHLVEAANQAGGADNIAVVLVRLSK
jgi:protein phosphatase